MRILINGASGFIGSHLIRALYEQHEVMACARNTRKLEQAFPTITVIGLDVSTDKTVDDWRPLLQGVDVVINAVGIIRETGRQTFEQLHHRAACTLFQACVLAGVTKVIQISALGADETAYSQYHLSKKAADDCLQQLDLDWVILKPSLVYGPGGKSAVFFKALSCLPRIPVVNTGEQLIQPIHIDDLTGAVSALLAPGAPVRISVDMVGPTPISFRDMLTGYRNWLGMGSPNFLPVPYPLALLLGKLAGFLGNTPMTAEAMQMLQRGNTGDATTLRESLHSPPRPFAAALAEQPAEQADRWHARLFFLRPLLRLTIGLLWLATGMLSLGLYPAEQSHELLAQIGVTGLLAPVALYGAALLDLGLGFATLARYRIHHVGLMQIILMLGYTALISTGLQEYWLHPFGPVTKNIPLVIATLIMMALEKD